jgi:hypothetical protein
VSASNAGDVEFSYVTTFPATVPAIVANAGDAADGSSNSAPKVPGGNAPSNATCSRSTIDAGTVRFTVNVRE